MKKILHFILAFFALSVLLSSCQMKKEATMKFHTVKLRFAENHVGTTPAALADKEFARLVEEKTHGRVRIEVVTGGALTETSSEAIDALRYGDIAFTRISSTPLSKYVPKINAIQLPYLYRSSSHMWNVLNGKVGQEILGDVEKAGVGLVGLCYYDAGSRNFYSTKEIRSVSDMKDLRIRVQGGLMNDMCEALGAVPVTGIEMSLVRENIENGNIDAAENNWPTYQTTGDYTVAKYFVLDQHTRVPEMVLASKKVLSSLPAEYVKAIEESAKLTQEFEIAKWKEMESGAERIVRANGNTVTELSQESLEEFQDAMQPVYDKYASDFGYILREIQNTK